MTSPTPPEKKARSAQKRQLRTCRKKKAFDRVQDAAVQIAADWMNNGIIGLTTYQCPVCNKFHNGRKQP